MIYKRLIEYNKKTGNMMLPLRKFYMGIKIETPNNIVFRLPTIYACKSILYLYCIFLINISKKAILKPDLTNIGLVAL